jgi:hypothetical protein
MLLLLCASMFNVVEVSQVCCMCSSPSLLWCRAADLQLDWLHLVAKKHAIICLWLAVAAVLLLFEAL